MAGSSMRNSLHRRNHKERAQPAHRAKLGLLEKHKDYVHRARDYAAKRERLKKLREKVAFRNKDEFYWGMVKARTEGGVHVQGRGNEPLPVEVVRLLKTQDAGYIRTQVSVETSKITAVKMQLQALADLISPSEDLSDLDSDADEVDLETLRLAGVIPPEPAASQPMSAKRKGKARATMAESIPARGHTIFVDSRDEFQTYRPADDSSDNNDDDDVASVASSSKLPAMAPAPEPLDMGYVIPKDKKSRKEKRSQDTEESKARREIELDEQEQALAEEAKLHRRALLAELSARVQRLAQLRAVEGHMTQQRAMMGRGSKRIQRQAEKVVDEDSGDEAGNGAYRKVSWRPKVVKWKAERKR